MPMPCSEGKGPPSTPDSKFADSPDVGLVVEFLMQAESLAHGKVQTDAVQAVTDQFATLMVYVAKVERQRNTLSVAHKALLKSKMFGSDVNVSFPSSINRCLGIKV